MNHGLTNDELEAAAVASETWAGKVEDGRRCQGNWFAVQSHEHEDMTCPATGYSKKSLESG